MKRRFEVISQQQWYAAAHRASLHEDVEQVLSHLSQEPRDCVRIKVSRSPEAKRHVLLEYAHRRGMKIRTACPRDGWIYVRLHDGEVKRGRPRMFEEVTAAEFEERRKAPFQRGARQRGILGVVKDA